MDFQNLGMKIETTIENVPFRGPLSEELAFYAAITNERNQFVKRSEQNVKDQVYSLVPIQELEKKAKLRFKELFQEDPKISLKFLRDLAVYELVQWFKNDFFTWVDKLKCDICNVDMMPTGMAYFWREISNSLKSMFQGWLNQLLPSYQTTLRGSRCTNAHVVQYPNVFQDTIRL